MIAKMLKITLISLPENVDSLIQSLLEIQCFHPKKFENIELHDYEVSELYIKKVNEDYLRIQAMQNFFQDKTLDLSKQTNVLDPQIVLSELESEIKSWKQRKTALQHKITVYSKYKSLLSDFLLIIPDIPFGSELQARGILIETTTTRIEKLLSKHLHEATNSNFDLELIKISNDLSIGSLVYLKQDEQKVSQILDQVKISEISLPQEIKGTSLKDMIEQLQSVLISETNLVSQIDLEYRTMYQKFIGLGSFIKQNQKQLEILHAMGYLKQSDHLVMIEGYIPKIRKEYVINSLKSKINENELRIICEPADTSAPVAVLNSSKIQPYQIFTSMLPPLAYGSLDPTIWIAIFFPIFFGFIVGDIAYGLIIFGFGSLLKHQSKGNENKTIWDIGFIYQISGISTTIFGVLYGEFFGNFGESLGLKPIWMHRSEDLISLLIISILIGLIHVCIGLTLGCINSRLTNRVHLFYENLGLLLIILALGLFSINQMNRGYFYINILCIGILSGGVFTLFLGGGFISLLEIVSVFGNILSYARLMALGVASVILADLANELYIITGGGIQGLLVAIILHALNIAIAMFSPLIHSMRLHLVEFFSKFVNYGEEVYSPLGTINGKIGG